MTALVFMFALGAACGHYLPRGWQQASEADRLDALRRRPAPRWRLTWRDRLRALARWGWR